MPFRIHDIFTSARNAVFNNPMIIGVARDPILLGLAMTLVILGIIWLVVHLDGRQFAICGLVIFLFTLTALFVQNSIIEADNLAKSKRIGGELMDRFYDGGSQTLVRASPDYVHTFNEPRQSSVHQSFAAVPEERIHNDHHHHAPSSRSSDYESDGESVDFSRRYH